MIISNALSAGSFLYCMTHVSPHEEAEYFNGGDGHYHQYAYLVEGYGIAEIRSVSGGPIVAIDDTKQAGTLIDQSSYRDMYYTIKTADSGVTLFFFNPVPSTRNLSVNIVNAGTHTVTATDKTITIVCITGPVTAAGKEILSMQYAKVFSGSAIELVIPANAVCALVTE
jgi:hypothetical protein